MKQELEYIKMYQGAIWKDLQMPKPSRTHKSKKDYNRKESKKQLKKELEYD